MAERDSLAEENDAAVIVRLNDIPLSAIGKGPVGSLSGRDAEREK